MFEFRRLFQPAASRSQGGVAAENSARLELLDLPLLKLEAQAADRTAARSGAADKVQARLWQAHVWRDLARRTGDVIALRKAASAAQMAADEKSFYAGEARFEQALCAMLGCEMFGDEGLNAAADRALTEAAITTGLVQAEALGHRAWIAGLQALAKGEAMSALAALTGYDAAANPMRARPKDAAARLALAQARLERSVLTARCGQALGSDALIARAATDLGEVHQSLDAAYHPLTWSRAAIARAQILTQLGEINGDLRGLSEAIETLSRVFDVLLKDHSPLDWAAAQAAHGGALRALAAASGLDDAWSKASGAYDRAWSIVRDHPALKARAIIGERRAALAIQIAVAHGDLMELATVEAAFRCDLAAADPHRDAVGWALCQFNLGRVYLARGALGRATPEDKARAAMAIVEAQAVFDEYGLATVAAAAGRVLTAENSK